jgi:predicted permease
VSAAPGVRSAGAINFLPLVNWGFNSNLELEGRAPFPRGKVPLVEWRAVAGDYFPAMGIPLLAGRLLDARDGKDAPLSIVVNRTLARIAAENETQSLGQRVKVGDVGYTIVGVVADVRDRGLDQTASPELYLSVPQAPVSPGFGFNMSQTMTLVVRAAADDPVALTETLRRAVREVDPGLPLFKVQTLQTVINESVTPQRANSVLLGSFAAVALVLAAIGLYGVLSYAVAQRTRELGIRMALGAQRKDIFGLIVGGGMKIVALGLIIGLAAAFISTRLLTSFLYEVAPSDPMTFGIVAALLATVAFLANYVPAHRAMKVNPTVALRYE